MFGTSLLYSLIEKEERKRRDLLIPNILSGCLSTVLPMGVKCSQHCIQFRGPQVLSHLVGVLSNRLPWHHQYILIQKLFIFYVQPPSLQLDSCLHKNILAPKNRETEQMFFLKKDYSWNNLRQILTKTK